MPLAWLAVWKLARTVTTADGLPALSATLGLAILAGFPQPTLAVFASAAMFAVVLAALKIGRVQDGGVDARGVRDGDRGGRNPKFLPTYQLTQWSVAKYRAGWLGSGGGLYWQSLVSLVWPNYYSLFDMARFHGPGDISFLYLYCSILGLALAIYAVAHFDLRVGVFSLMTGFGLVCG